MHPAAHRLFRHFKGLKLGGTLSERDREVASPSKAIPLHGE
jgi:hypothetical protein